MERSEIRELDFAAESRIRFAPSGLRCPDARHRPVFRPAPGLAGYPVPRLPEGRAERQGVSPRPRRPHGLDAGTRLPRVRHTGSGPAQRRRSVGLNAGRGSRSSPAFRTRMDFAACCMSQGLSLAPTRPRSCELSPGHALGPSARLAGVCPCPLSRDLRSSLRPRSGIVAAIRIPLPRIEDDRDAPLTGAGCDRRYKSYREDQEQTENFGQLFLLRIRKALSAATTPKDRAPEIDYFDIAGVLGGGTAAVDICCASAVTLEVPMWPCSS